MCINKAVVTEVALGRFMGSSWYLGLWSGREQEIIWDTTGKNLEEKSVKSSQNATETLRNHFKKLWCPDGGLELATLVESSRIELKRIKGYGVFATPS